MKDFTVTEYPADDVILRETDNQERIIGYGENVTVNFELSSPATIEERTYFVLFNGFFYLMMNKNETPSFPSSEEMLNGFHIIIDPAYGKALLLGKDVRASKSGFEIFLVSFALIGVLVITRAIKSH